MPPVLGSLPWIGDRGLGVGVGLGCGIGFGVGVGSVGVLVVQLLVHSGTASATRFDGSGGIGLPLDVGTEQGLLHSNRVVVRGVLPFDVGTVQCLPHSSKVMALRGRPFDVGTAQFLLHSSIFVGGGMMAAVTDGRLGKMTQFHTHTWVGVWQATVH